jgi:hypothetical protein
MSSKSVNKVILIGNAGMTRRSNSPRVVFPLRGSAWPQMNAKGPERGIPGAYRVAHHRGLAETCRDRGRVCVQGLKSLCRRKTTDLRVERPPERGKPPAPSKLEARTNGDRLLRARIADISRHDSWHDPFCHSSWHKPKFRSRSHSMGAPHRELPRLCSTRLRSLLLRHL